MASTPRVVVIGTGWAGAKFVRALDTKKFDISVISARNHFVFTPLLPQTCTGTLEFRAVTDSVQRFQSLITKHDAFHHAHVQSIDFENQKIRCVAVDGSQGMEQAKASLSSFSVPYDFLVLAQGAKATTFNVPGVEDHAFFLREVQEARAIRNRLYHNIMRASLPSTPWHEAQRLLSIVIVGGGPTGVELAGELADFASHDLTRSGSHLKEMFSVTIVEAMEVLGTFPIDARTYAVDCLKKQGVKIVKAAVKKVTAEAVVLDGTELPSGLTVWSTGVGPTPLTNSLTCDKIRGGRIAIDTCLQVLKNGQPITNVFALGDCAAFDPSTGRSPLPTVAAVASRQGEYLAKALSNQTTELLSSVATNASTANKSKIMPGQSSVVSTPRIQTKPFEYRSQGMMASLGTFAAVVCITPATQKAFQIYGIKAWAFWRLAYWNMLDTRRTRLYVLTNWVGTYIWGRCATYVANFSEMKLCREAAEAEQKSHQKVQETSKVSISTAPSTPSTPVENLKTKTVESLKSDKEQVKATIEKKDN